MRAALLLLFPLLIEASWPAAADECVRCHAGAAERSYALSKHGVINRIEAGAARVRAPGCSDCHPQEAARPGPLHHANATQRAEARRQAVAGCGSCHAPRYVAEQLAAADRGRAIGEMKLREAQAVLDTAQREAKRDANREAKREVSHEGDRAGLADIQAQFLRMRDQHLRNLRLGLAHQSPDYQWWYGQAALDGDLLRIKGALAEARRLRAATGRSQVR